MSEKEMLKQTNKLLEGLKKADYQLLRQKSMLNQNVTTEDVNGNIVEVPARTVFHELVSRKLYIK